MPALGRGLGALALSLAGGPAALAAQIDYRNLEDHRPTRVEDAYPIERYGFELSFPYVFTAAPGAVRSHRLSPELEYGFARGAAAGLRLDLLAHREPGFRDAGASSAGVFVLLNLVRELPALPALSLRLDAGLPMDNLGGSGKRAALGLLATRSLGRNRLHANVAWTVAAPERAAAGETAPRWWAGVALDRTLFRSSTLLLAEVTAERGVGASRVAVGAGAGLRRQIRPTLVLHAGVSRGFSSGDRAWGVSLGLSHAFAVAALMPRGRP